MCTVSWVRDEAGYELLCNRDEKRGRASSSGPRLLANSQAAPGVRFLAPVDGDRGGTWISCNEYGVTLCLLNGANLTENAPVEAFQNVTRSRGLLVGDMAGVESIPELCERLWQTDLTPYAPFTLVALEPYSPAAIIEWNQREKVILPCGDDHMPLVSSSFDPSGVKRRRLKEFQRHFGSNRPDSAGLYRFHENHGPFPSAYSTCMHRPDAETVSFSWIKLTSEQVDFFYAPGAPCQWLPGETRSLSRTG